jgi:hypothetical protein
MIAVPFRLGRESAFFAVVISLALASVAWISWFSQWKAYRCGSPLPWSTEFWSNRDER